MKVGFVLDTTLDSNAGVQQYFKGLARFLIEKGNDIRFLVPPSKDEGEFKGRIYSFGKTIVLPGNANIVPTSFFVSKKKIKEVLDRENFDIIHISAPFMPQFGAKVIDLADCPVVSSYTIFSKSKIFLFFGLILGIFLSRIYKKIDGFIAISEAAKEEAKKTIPGKYKVIPVGIDLERFSHNVKPLEKFKGDKLNILIVSRLEKRKGVKYLVKAFDCVKKQFPKVQLIIAGDGSQRVNLERLVTDLKLNDVIFEGYITEEIKPNYYASADLCVFPSIFGESFGVVLIESMASGKTTIAFANEGYSTVLKGFPKLLVTPRDTRELSSRILEFLRDDKLREEYSNRCLKEASKYKWERVGRQVLDVYKEITRSEK